VIGQSVTVAASGLLHREEKERHQNETGHAGREKRRAPTVALCDQATAEECEKQANIQAAE